MKLTWKKLLISVGVLLLAGTTVLAVHIYQVTRPQITDAERIVMARVDFQQDISADDATKITEWLYANKGIHHVLCNAETNIAVFTFYPAQADANNIIADLKKAGNYKAERYLPSAAAMKSGCPVN